MKRTKVFLGLTTCVLAVAGVAASKAAKFQALVTRYYCTKTSQSVCVVTKISCNDQSSIKCTIQKNVNGSVVAYTLYHLQPNFTTDGCAIPGAKCFDQSPATKNRQ